MGRVIVGRVIVGRVIVGRVNGYHLDRLRRVETRARRARGPYIVGQALSKRARANPYPSRRSIVVGVTGFKLTISMCSLIR